MTRAARLADALSCLRQARARLKFAEAAAAGSDDAILQSRLHSARRAVEAWAQDVATLSPKKSEHPK